MKNYSAGNWNRAGFGCSLAQDRAKGRRPLHRQWQQNLHYQWHPADYYTVAVRTGGEGHGGISLLMIERGTPALVGRKLQKNGLVEQ